ncbi:MAG: hypothetical protein JEZ00_00635 [Anaerolineaceae bacterium]|nr:hypothetical protein [Anaerolineaceae bacterium]
MAGKVSKSKNSHQSKNKGMNVHPVIEAGVAVVKILVLVSAALVFVISLMAHAEWYAIAIRTSLTMILVGLLGWYANWMLGKWVLKYEMKKFEEQDRQ